MLWPNTLFAVAVVAVVVSAAVVVEFKSSSLGLIFGSDATFLGILVQHINQK